MMKRIFIFPFLGLMLSGVAVVLLLLSNFYTFHRLVDEEPIAELRFSRLGQQAYEAVLRYGDFCTPEKYLLYGDQWRLDAEFLKWRPWANLLGFDSMYRIDRLGSRYQDIQSENSDLHAAYELVSGMPLDLTSLIASYDGYFTPVDTLYGSSVYAAMDDSAVYRVFRGQSGLFVRKDSATRGTGTDSGLTIEIDAACADKPGIPERLGRYLKRYLGATHRH